MTAIDFLKAGDLDAALAALQADVRKAASDARLRIFLFQLLSVRGDWTRAVAQLKLSAELDPLALPMAQTYREGIRCELQREKVFAGEKDPMIFGQPQEWIALLVEAVKHLAAGRAAEAASLRARAFDMAPETRGTLNGAPFDWIADADMRLGPVLEIVINGRYFWMPFNALSALAVEEPADLRDCVWTPAHVTLKNGGDVAALIPTRYAGTVARGDDAARLSRKTDWVDAGADTFIGIGQRLLATDAGDVALMDLRSLTIEQAGEPEPVAVPSGADGARDG